MPVEIIFRQSGIIGKTYQETAIGAIDGINKKYSSTYSMVEGTTEIYIRGVKCETNTYIILNEKEFELDEALEPDVFNRIEIIYQRKYLTG